MPSEHWPLSVVVITMTYMSFEPLRGPHWIPWLWPLQGCAYGSGWTLNPGKAIIWGESSQRHPSFSPNCDFDYFVRLLWTNSALIPHPFSIGLKANSPGNLEAPKCSLANPASGLCPCSPGHIHPSPLLCACSFNTHLLREACSNCLGSQ